MSAPNWLSFVSSASEALIVSATMPSKGPVLLRSSETWKLEAGARPQAYAALRRRTQDYLSDNAIDLVVYREAASNQFGSGPELQLAAELRGVMLSAVGESGVCSRAFKKGVVSRTFGPQKIGEYLRDETFWRLNCIGDVPRSHREAAFYLFAARV
mgnify:CR=1 FL=1